MTSPAPGPATVVAGEGAVPDLARSTAAMTALTAVSRLTGLVRLLVVAAVLGTTFLGNTYQSANTVPTVLFELFAAGVLQSVLIPSLVELLDRGERAEAEHVAGSILGLAGAALAVLAGIGMLVAPWVMRVLTSGVSSVDVREDQIRLGTILLWCFLPQVVLYAAGMVATGVLNARNRFALPTFAPVLNNVVVTASYGLFWVLRDGAAPSLDLSATQVAVLGGGTTLGVLALSTLPVWAVARSGFSLRPRFDARHPEVRRVVRLGGWAALYLAANQALIAVVLVLANGVEGGVVAYQVAYALFLTPHALFALPVLTARFPSLARAAAAADGKGYAATVASGVQAIAFFLLPATAAMVALANPVAELALFGESRGSVAPVAGAVAAFGPGLLGYGASLFLARALYATGDTRTPALVNLAVAAGGALAMAAGAALVSPSSRVAALAGAHSAAHLLGALALLRAVRRRAPAGTKRLAVGRPLAVTTAAAGVATAVMWAVQQPIDVAGRTGALAALALAGVLGVGAYVGAQAVMGGPRPAGVVALLRGGDG